MQNASDVVNRVTEVILLMVLSAMAVVVFLQVIFRYVINFPLFWTEEFARYCLVWASLLGAAAAIKRGQHIAVTFLMDHLPSGARRILSKVALVSVASILAVILWGGIQLVMMTRAQLSPALRISMSIPYLAVPVGSAIMLFHIIVFIFYSPRQTDATHP